MPHDIQTVLNLLGEADSAELMGTLRRYRPPYMYEHFHKYLTADSFDFRVLTLDELIAFLHAIFMCQNVRYVEKIHDSHVNNFYDSSKYYVDSVTYSYIL